MALQFDDFDKLKQIFQDEELDNERKQAQKLQERKIALQERKIALQERKQRQIEKRQDDNERQPDTKKPNTGLWLWTFCILGSIAIEFIVLLIVLLKY